MKIKQVTRKLLFALKVIVVLVVVIVGYIEARFFTKYMYKPDKKDASYFLGKVGDRVINCHLSKKKNSEGIIEKMFGIAINDKFIYVETDSNGDGITDIITYLEKGKERYGSFYDSSTGKLKGINVEYYNDGKRSLILFDTNASGKFITHINYLAEKGKEKEVFFDNKWRTVIKKDKISGYINDEGAFIALEYVDREWRIIDNKMIEEDKKDTRKLDDTNQLSPKTRRF